VKAAVYDHFRSRPVIRDVPEPVPADDSAIIEVKACGVCRSDWHAWMGHDSEVRLPHVGGHELAGVVANVGVGVRRWQPGDRVTVPFCCGCDGCRQCVRGNHHICDFYTQPGFTHWGAFADRVEIRFADVNLVKLPEAIDFVTAASLGCRFATSFRGVVDRGRTRPGDWVAVHGCGGVGLSAVMIAVALGARVIAIDRQSDRLAAAKRAGAVETIDATSVDVVAAVRGRTDGGADVSIDALGSHQTCRNSIACLAKRGRHVQIGLMLGDAIDPPVPMGMVIANELEIHGSHGMPAHDYPRLLAMITAGILNPKELIADVVSLERGMEILCEMDRFPGAAMSVCEWT
jgi:alcohol dehydrogenase